MKKTLTLLAIMAAIGPAWAADVVSSNVVGYNKVTLLPGYNMIASDFFTVGDEEQFSIPDMFSDADNATAALLTDNADRIDTWDSSEQRYVSYYRLTNRRQTSVWWGKEGAATETTDAFPEIGAGAFYYNQSSESITLTLSGQVKSTDAELSVVPGFNLFCNPFPSELSFTELDWSNATAALLTDNADRIDTWDAEEQRYVSYYYLTNRRRTDVWWGKEGAATATTDSIPAGQAFFYYSQAASSWTLTLPTPLPSGGTGD